MAEDEDTPKLQPVFPKLDADSLVPEITEVESLCTQCGENGTTKLLLTKIPFYKEVVVMSFSCDHCLWQNNELQPAAVIQEKGVLYRLQVETSEDLQRCVVKTEWASVVIPELDFEIPRKTQEGTVTTVEGVLQRAYEGIKKRHEVIEAQDSYSGRKLFEFLEKLSDLKEGKSPFCFLLRDCSGNSFIESIDAEKSDTQLKITQFERNKEESQLLGIVVCEEPNEDDREAEGSSTDLKDEVLEFPSNCSNCNAPCVTNMKLTHIPLFKDVVIMATVCETCGHKTNEVKNGGGIEPFGIRYTLKIKDSQDLNRDLLKSDTCEVRIPELELDVGATALSGCYTTVEGLITNMKKQLIEDNPFLIGDSAQPRLKEKLNAFLLQLDEILTGCSPCTLVLDDPCGGSYLQSIYEADSDDSLTMEKYTRTFEQNEDLGLNDMKVENYEDEDS